MATNSNRGFLLGRGAGELIIIVVGVLIALAVDAAWSSRAERMTETAYLGALDDDISRSLTELGSVEAQVRGWLAAAETLSKMSTDDPVPPDSLTFLIGEALFSVTQYDNRLTTHEELKASGRLGLFSNREVRRRLAEVDGLLEAIRFQERDLMGAQHATFDGFLLSRTDLADVARAGWPAAAQYMGPGVGQEHAALLADREFRGLVALRIVIVSEMLLRYEGLSQHLRELQSLITTD